MMRRTVSFLALLPFLLARLCVAKKLQKRMNLLCLIAFISFCSLGDGFFVSNTISSTRLISRKQPLLSMNSLKIREIQLQTPKIEKIPELYGLRFGFPVIEQDKSINMEVFPSFNVKYSKYEGKSRFHKGASYIGLGLEVLGAEKLFNDVKAKGSKLVEVEREFDNYEYGASFVPEEDDDLFTPVQYGWLKDFNGYRMELKEANQTAGGCKVFLNVVDPDISTQFYTEVLGLKLFRRRAHIISTPPDTCISLTVGDESDREGEGVMFELVYAYMTESLDHGHALKEIVLEASDLDGLVQRLEEKQQKFEKVDKAVVLCDPDGYKLRIQASE